jgi:glycosyltransferase involved in cell wall biosynthesis
MKIAYSIPSLFNAGGMERVLTIKANYLAEVSNYDVFIIITDGKQKKPYYELSPKIHIVQLDINYDELYGKSLLKRIKGYFFKQRMFKKKLKKALFDIKPDITISLLRREINFLSGIKDGSIKIGEIHFGRLNYREFRGDNFLGPLKQMIKKCWMLQLIHNLKKLDCFVVLTYEDKERWPELKKNIVTIHNPLSFFPETVSDCCNHQAIAAGRYFQEKGFDLLINAWSIVTKKHPDWILKIYGDGALRSSLTEQIFSLGIENNCLLEPTVNNIIEKYCESSIFVFSSRNEGFGLVITEAMSCGLPAVSFACPSGPKDIIRDGEDGLLVSNGNVQEMAEKICYLIENETIRKEMGRKARIQVERFRVEKIMKQWEQLFLSLLNKSKA